MATPCIPTFSSKLKIIEDISSMLAYIINIYLTVPDGYLETNAKYTRSLAKDVVEIGGDADLLQERVTESLEYMISNLFPSRLSLDITVSYVDNESVENIVDKEVKIGVALTTIDGQIYQADKLTLVRLQGGTTTYE